uniref:Uncharacterized protein n=1 Tax=Cacopsylla melanoneura TaxID=428564 RepID=A0A8D9AXI2_9HEMI
MYQHSFLMKNMIHRSYKGSVILVMILSVLYSWRLITPLSLPPVLNLISFIHSSWSGLVPRFNGDLLDTRCLLSHGMKLEPTSLTSGSNLCLTRGQCFGNGSSRRLLTGRERVIRHPSLQGCRNEPGVRCWRIL